MINETSIFIGKVKSEITEPTTDKKECPIKCSPHLQDRARRMNNSPPAASTSKGKSWSPAYGGREDKVLLFFNLHHTTQGLERRL
jgi:hypothetical protein